MSGKAVSSFFTDDGMLMPWFHGRMTRQEANAILENGPKGYFLVRFSETSPRNLTLTCLDLDPTTDNTLCKHILIYNLGERGFSLFKDPPGERDMYKSVRALIEDNSNDFREPCISGMYKKWVEDVSMANSSIDGRLEAMDELSISKHGDGKVW